MGEILRIKNKNENEKENLKMTQLKRSSSYFSLSPLINRYGYGLIFFFKYISLLN